MNQAAFRVRWGAVLLLLALAATSTTPAGAAEATLFLSGASPGIVWKGGVGGAFAITLFNIAGVEVEGAHQGGEIEGSGILTASGRIFVAPPIGRVVPYGGLSVGTYRSTLGSDDDWGTMSGVFVGAKLKLPLGLVLRGEYQWTHFPDAVLVPMEARYYAGVGLHF